MIYQNKHFLTAHSAVAFSQVISYLLFKVTDVLYLITSAGAFRMNVFLKIRNSRCCLGLLLVSFPGIYQR